LRFDDQAVEQINHSADGSIVAYSSRSYTGFSLLSILNRFVPSVNCPLLRVPLPLGAICPPRLQPPSRGRLVHNLPRFCRPRDGDPVLDRTGQGRTLSRANSDDRRAGIPTPLGVVDITDRGVEQPTHFRHYRSLCSLLYEQPN
jgi:hypothetical protein